AFAGLQLTHGTDDAADGRIGFDRFAAARAPAIRRLLLRGLRLRKRRNRLRAQIREGSRIAIDRVSAPIEAQRFLFERELLGVRPWRRRREDERRRFSGGGLGVLHPEETALSPLAVRLRAGTPFARAV